MLAAILIIGSGAPAGTTGPCPRNPGKEKRQKCGAVHGAEQPSAGAQLLSALGLQWAGRPGGTPIHSPHAGASEGRLTSVLRREQ